MSCCNGERCDVCMQITFWLWITVTLVVPILDVIYVAVYLDPKINSESNYTVEIVLLVALCLFSWGYIGVILWMIDYIATEKCDFGGCLRRSCRNSAKILSNLKTTCNWLIFWVVICSGGILLFLGSYFSKNGHWITFWGYCINCLAFFPKGIFQKFLFVNEK